MKTEETYNWKRYWYPRAGNMEFDYQGYLCDPESENAMFFQSDVVPFEKISNIKCLVLLGEPGIGKTKTIKNEIVINNIDSSSMTLSYRLGGYSDENRLIKEIFENSDVKKWKDGTNNLNLFLDGLDECLVDTSVTTRILVDALQNFPKDRLFLRIVCRTADWPNSLEQSLSDLWGKEQLGIYVLAPLCRKHVYEAANKNLDNPDAFMEAVAERNIVPFAFKPITLNMLINTFKNDDELPSSKYELYEKGCRNLCDEHNETRRDSTALRGNLSVDEKMVVASRIAAATLLCKKNSIWTGNKSGEVSKEDITFSDLLGSEEYNGSNIDIKDQVIRDTLSTGLFTLLGPQKMGFVHHTYAEFLAAKYLIDHKVPVKQISSLITCADDYDYSVVPQLYGLSSWIAGVDNELFKIMLECDPESLLRCDLSFVGDKQKETLIERLLDEHDKRYLVEHFIDNQTLSHIGIEEQLSGYICDKSKANHVRNMAMEILMSCKTYSLLNNLVCISLDNSEPVSVRERAVYVVFKCGDKETKSKLKPLVINQSQEDTNDNLKGIALKALWPESITTKELFSILTPPKKHGHIAQYQMFVSFDAIKQLKPHDLPIALEWAEKECANYSEHTCFSTFIDSIMILAWNNLQNPDVLKQFAITAFERLKRRHTIINNNKEFVFEVELRRNSDKRLKFLNEIIGFISNERECFYLTWGTSRILLGSDLNWLISKFEMESETIQKTLIAHMIDLIIDFTDDNHLNILYHIYKSDPILENTFSRHFQVDLNSHLAESMRNNYIAMKEHEKLIAARHLDPPPNERIALILDECESGNIKQWWKLKREMTLEPDGTTNGDLIESEITELTGWKSADNATKARIIDFAKKYLVAFMPATKKWIFQEKYYYPDHAGYWALRLLYQLVPEHVKCLGYDVWKKLVPIIIAYPACGELISSSDHTTLLSMSYKAAPDLFVETLLKLIDHEDEKFKNLYILVRIEGFLDEAISKALMDKIQTRSLAAACESDILIVLLRNKAPGAIDFSKKLIVMSDIMTDDEKERVLCAAAPLFFYGERAGWDAVWPLIDSDQEIGDEVIASISFYHDRNPQKYFIYSLTEKNIAKLFARIVKVFRYEDDPEIGGARWVTSRDNIQTLRDALLGELVRRGTEQSCAVLEWLTNEFPSYRWLKHKLHESRLTTRLNRWRPTSPSEVLKLIENKQSRIINSGNQLLDLLIESLKRLEQELQGETPAARDLWNETNKKYSPKNESALSDYVKRHLDEDLQNVVLNREVEIRKSMGGRQGEQTDIHVDVVIPKIKSSPPQKIKAIIEVKGCWNKDIDTAMETQLFDRYLKDNQCHHGLYLVGWFNCPQWDKSDYRKKNTSKASLDDLRTKFVMQADILSKNNSDVQIICNSYNLI